MKTEFEASHNTDLTQSPSLYEKNMKDLVELLNPNNKSLLRSIVSSENVMTKKS